MGRRAVASFDEVLLQKCSAVINRVLDDLDEQGELEHVDLLYPPGTFAHASSSSARIQSSNSSEQPVSRPRYTFEQFVDHLDVNDATFGNLIELLVTTTARKAIARAANLNVDDSQNGQRHAEQSTRSSANVVDRFRSASSSAAAMMDRAASMRAARACQREMIRNRALQGEIRGITRRSRRLHRSDSIDSSTSESNTGLLRSPPPTRTVFSSLLDPPSYPPLQSVIAGADGATTRASRVGHGSTTYRWLQRDLSSMRRRSQRQEFNLANNDPIVVSPSSNDRSNNFRVTDNATNEGTDEHPDMSVVHRFLSQPWTTDGQSAVRTGVNDDQRSHFDITAPSNDGLHATLAPTLDIERRSSSPDLFTNAASSLDPSGIEMHAQHGDSTSGSQARLDAIHAALNRLTSSAPLPSSDPVRQMSLSSLPPSYEIIGGRSNPIAEFNTYSAHRRQAQRDRRAALDEHRRRSEAQEEREHRAALDRALASLNEADETISQAVQRVNDDSLSAAIASVASSPSRHHASTGNSAGGSVIHRGRPIVTRNRVRNAEERRSAHGATSS